MRLVVADTGPLNYLVLIGASDILPKLFATIAVPDAVCAELRHPRTPASVRAWAMQPPPWIDVRPVPAAAFDDPALGALGAGEQAALVLARAIHADLILMDDRAGVVTARNLRLSVIGTLGVLDLAAHRGLLDLDEAFTRLTATNFRYRPEIMEALLTQHRKGGGR
jgi:predicted nucleic acid-binding protein